MIPIKKSWPVVIPLLGLAALLLKPYGLVTAIMAIVLVGVVIAAVHHAEVIAHKVGEPYGSLVLALAVTVIEAGLIVTLMLAGKNEIDEIARDTVFAAAMLILNLIIGLCLLVGGIKHNEQGFTQSGATAALATIAILMTLTMILPNFTVSAPGGLYTPVQLATVAALSFILYSSFIFVQTVRHRSYFLPSKKHPHGEEDHAPKASGRQVVASLALLVASLFSVVLLAKKLSPVVEGVVLGAGLPLAVVGVVIATVVLLPEALASLRAAWHNRLQTSLNLALGSAIATIGLTIPAVAVVSIYFHLPLSLGLEPKEIVLAALTFFVAALSITRGMTTVLQGMLHLVIFAAYLLVTVVP